MFCSLNILTEWFEKSSAVTIFVAVLLSLYFISTFWIFFYRFFFLNGWLKKEKDSSDAFLLGGKSLKRNSFLYNCHQQEINKNFLSACLEAATKEATTYLSMLSIIASTSPFIGLFGTVVGILESFSTFKEGVTLSAVAPAISEALVATAFGILVAIPAYAFHLTLKRIAYEINTHIKMQINFLLSSKENE